MEDKIFFKYKSFVDKKGNDISKWTFDSIINKYFFFSRPSQLNDPEDCRVINEYEAEDFEIQNWINKSPSRSRFTVELMRSKLEDGTFESSLEKSARKDEEYFHILSLTDSWQNLHLWKKYASEFSGICIGYKSTFNDGYNDCIQADRLIKDVPIVKIFRNVNGKGYFFLQKISYDNDKNHKYNIFKSDDLENRKNIEYAILHKTEKWAKENEYRAFFLDTLMPPADFTPKDLLVFYPDNVLAEINFGYNCNLEIQKLIIDYVKNYYSNSNNIHFYQVMQKKDGGIVRADVK